MLQKTEYKLNKYSKKLRVYTLFIVAYIIAKNEQKKYNLDKKKVSARNAGLKSTGHSMSLTQLQQ